MVKVNRGYKIHKKIILFQVSDPLLVCLVLTMGVRVLASKWSRYWKHLQKEMQNNTHMIFTTWLLCTTMKPTDARTMISITYLLKGAPFA